MSPERVLYFCPSEIYNATPDTVLHSFEKVDYDSIFKDGTGKIFSISQPVGVSTDKHQKSVTILICMPDLYSDLTKKCIESVKQYTKNIDYESLIFENGQ